MSNPIKTIINSNKVTKSAKDYVKASSYYGADRKHYYKAKAKHASEDYAAIMLAHSLEKGMSFDNPRPFGKDKIRELIDLFYRIKTEDKTAIEIVVNTLREYKRFYEKHSWQNEPEYKTVREFIEKNKKVPEHEAGVKTLSIEEIQKEGCIDFGKFLASRHSIRNFDDKKLEPKDFKKAIEIARLTPTACNRQMIKATMCKSERAKNAVVETIRKNLSGFNLETITPIVITFDAAAFNGPQERNQGWLNAGLFTMNLVNVMHSIGIASCICEFRPTIAKEKALKKALNIPESERIAVTIMAGYYRKENKVYVSQRISSDELMRVE